MTKQSFSEFNLHPLLVEAMSMMGYKTPTPVQVRAIPPAIEGKDLIACAQTGTGKTAAFVLPILNQIIQNPGSEIYALVIAPTRELAMQIDQQFLGLGYFANISSLAVYGGSDSVGWDQQKKALTTGVNVVVATPGRLISHLNLGYVKLDSLRTVVLDEADRMLDMGFFEDIIKIMKHASESHQTLMYSATMPPKIRGLANKILSNPEEISIAISKPAENVLQAAYMVYDKDKPQLVAKLLKGKELNSVLLFSATKVAVKLVAKTLKNLGLSVGEIHSDLDQKTREETLRLYKSRKFQVLVATDIVSRGIDIEGIDLIINYDVPKDPEDYVHRIGRTARAERSGVAITLINEKDQYDFHRIEDLIERVVIKSPSPDGIPDGPDYKPMAARKNTYYRRGRKRN
ncbi:MAG: DEAD/DEAH box helicase [Bacteroidales bacterium]|nr:DEAD/DEAH box helicase [Bacteroidales bacterium]